MLTISKKEIIMFTAGVVGSITVIVTYVMKKKVEKTTYKVESTEVETRHRYYIINVSP